MAAATVPPAQLPLVIAIAPFPEGFEGDCDEYGQQLVQLMEAYVLGNFLTGLVLAPGSTLPPTDQGPIFMDGVWYWFNPTTGTYVAQSLPAKAAKNYVKNCTYQVQQTGSTFTAGAGVSNIYDLGQVRSTLASVLSVKTIAGPVAGPNNDQITDAANFTVGTTLVPTPAATDLYAHEHLVEGSDLAPAQGQVLSLSFWVYSNTPGLFPVYIASSGRDCSFVSSFTIPTANTWTRITVQGIPAIPIATGTWNFGEGQTACYIGFGFAVGNQWLSASPNTWQSGFFATVAGALNLCAVTNNQFAVTGIKLEASSVASYLSVPPFEADFHDAIRYYWTTFTYQLTNAGVPIEGVAYLANSVLFSYLFPRRMARVPTVVPYGWTSYAAGKVTNISTGIDYTCATFGATQKGVAASPSGLTAAKADVFAAYITADARLS
jgi:hypothetical protein